MPPKILLSKVSLNLSQLALVHLAPLAPRMLIPCSCFSLSAHLFSKVTLSPQLSPSYGEIPGFYLQLWPLSQGLTLYFKLWIKHLYLGSLLGLLNSVRISVIFTSLHIPIPKFTPGWVAVAIGTHMSFLSPKRITHHWVSPHCSSVLGDLPPGYNWLTQGGPSRITLCEVWNLEMDRCHGQERPNMRHLQGSPLLWCLLPLVSALHSSARFTSPSLLVSLPVPFCPLRWPLV